MTTLLRIIRSILRGVLAGVIVGFILWGTVGVVVGTCEISNPLGGFVIAGFLGTTYGAIIGPFIGGLVGFFAEVVNVATVGVRAGVAIAIGILVVANTIVLNPNRSGSPVSSTPTELVILWTCHGIVAAMLADRDTFAALRRRLRRRKP